LHITQYTYVTKKAHDIDNLEQSYARKEGKKKVSRRAELGMARDDMEKKFLIL
jgi:hypothetical protein